MKKLLTLEETENLDIRQVWDLYRRFVNPGQQELISTFSFGQELAQRAEGCWIYTDNNRRILDFTGGIGVLNHGHNHPRIIAARQRYQKDQKMEVHKNYFSPHLAALSHNISQLLPDDLDISYFPNSGAEAVEGAIKLAYKFHQGQRKYVLHSDISYHGKLLGAGSITATKEVHFRYPPALPYTRSFEYGNIDSIRQLTKELKQENQASDIYALIVEPMSASSLRFCDGNFLSKLRQLCNDEGIILIFDEVFTGWGKTGKLFYFMHYDVLPDVLVTSKSLGGGKASIAGYVARTPVFNQAYGNLGDALLHTTSYNGYGEECATALEAVNVLIEEDMINQAGRLDSWISQGLEQIRQQHPGRILEVRGRGALHGLLLNCGPEFYQKLIGLVPSTLLSDDRFMQKVVTSALINELYNEHSILTYYGDNKDILLMISPPLVSDKPEVDLFMKGLDHVLSRGLGVLCLKFVRSKLFAKFLTMYGIRGG